MEKNKAGNRRYAKNRKQRLLAAVLSFTVALGLCVSPQLGVAVWAEEPGESNDVVITENTEISEDWTVNGNLTIDAKGFLASSKLSLKGHTLTVNGNLIITDAGELEFSHGKVIVNGNIIVGQKSTTSDIENRGCLIMNYEDEEIRVAGDFITYYLGTYNYFDGTMYLGGNFLDKRDNPSFFNQNTRFKLVLYGTGKQLLSLGSSGCYFNQIIVPDDYRGKVYISNYFMFSQLGCDLEVTCDTTEYEKTHIGQYEAFGMNFNGYTLTVNGDVNFAGLLKLEKGKLVINGDVMQMSASEIGAPYVELGDGELDIKGNYTIKDFAYTRMQDADGIIRISKNFEMFSDSDYNRFTAGTMYIGGDVTGTNFFPDFNHTVVLNGENLQTIDFGDSNSHFNYLELTKDKNTGYKFKPEKCWKKILSQDQSETDDPAQEEHTYSSSWSFDANSHWKECTKKDGAKKDTAAHTFKIVIDKVATTSVAGSKHEECTVCGYKKTAVSIPKLSGTVKAASLNAIVKVSNPGKVVNGKVMGAEAAYIKSAVSKATVTVPDSVTINGVKYSVTSVAKNAFKNDKKLTKVTIGSNVKTIGADAFSGCKNLKTVIFKESKAPSIGNNALKGIKKNAAIKVPKKAYDAYKKKFTATTGYKNTMKIKKV